MNMNIIHFNCIRNLIEYYQQGWQHFFFFGLFTIQHGCQVTESDTCLTKTVQRNPYFYYFSLNLH